MPYSIVKTALLCYSRSSVQRLLVFDRTSLSLNCSQLPARAGSEDVDLEFADAKYARTHCCFPVSKVCADAL